MVEGREMEKLRSRATLRALLRRGVVLMALLLLFACAHHPVDPELCEGT